MSITTSKSGTLLLIVGDGREFPVIHTLRVEAIGDEQDGADVLALILERRRLVDGEVFDVDPPEELAARAAALNGRSRAVDRTRPLYDRPLEDCLSDMAMLAPGGGKAVFDAHRSDD